jgi:hypothetical protein
MVGRRQLWVSVSRSEWRADDSASCGVPSLTMLGAPLPRGVARRVATLSKGAPSGSGTPVETGEE